jgi:proteasome lid subunit RPN8/RPN11
MSEKLFFRKDAWDLMVSASEAGYPREVCGLLFGPADSTRDPAVTRVVILDNILEEKHADRLKRLVEAKAVALPDERMKRGGAFEFLIDPEQHYQQILQAQKDDLDQVGLFHSHPDHPAVPSATDAAQPFLSGWANLVVAVHGGKFKETRAWFRKTEQDPFQEQQIVIE